MDRLEHEAEAAEARAKKAYAEGKDKAIKAEKDAKAKAKKVAARFEANSDNPVFIGNAVAVVALSAGLGFGAYRKYAAGELSWKVVGAGAVVVGLFGLGDYYISQYVSCLLVWEFVQANLEQVPLQEQISPEEVDGTCGS